MFPQLLANGIIAGSIYALVGLGFAVIYRTTKFFHFAHGAVYTAGAYFAYLFLRQLRISPVLGIALSLLLSAALGVLIEASVYSPLRRRRAPALVLLLSSLGVFIFIQNLIQLAFGAGVLTLTVGPPTEGHQVIGAVITNTQIVIIVASAFLAGVFALFVRKTKLGKAMRAVSDDPIGASVVGINPQRIVLVAFAVGSALAGAAAMLNSLETAIEPTMGMSAILKGITASIVGGIGSVPGVLAGGLFLGIVENLGVWRIQAGWQDAIAFGVLILFLVIRPGGIFGERPEKERP